MSPDSLDKIMTKFSYDRFAKDYLEEILKDYGEIYKSYCLTDSEREIDVYFTPKAEKTSNLTQLGLLGRFIEKPAVIEIFRSEVSEDSIQNSLLKLFKLQRQIQYPENSDPIDIEEEDLPVLWVLAPNAPSKILAGFDAKPHKKWITGVYLMPPAFRSAIVAIDQLPKTPETLLLRVLGTTTVREQAIIDLAGTGSPISGWVHKYLGEPTPTK